MFFFRRFGKRHANVDPLEEPRYTDHLHFGNAQPSGSVEPPRVPAYSFANSPMPSYGGGYLAALNNFEQREGFVPREDQQRSNGLHPPPEVAEMSAFPSPPLGATRPEIQLPQLATIEEATADPESRISAVRELSSHPVAEPAFYRDFDDFFHHPLPTSAERHLMNKALDTKLSQPAGEQFSWEQGASSNSHEMTDLAHHDYSRHVEANLRDRIRETQRASSNVTAPPFLYSQGIDPLFGPDYGELKPEGNAIHQTGVQAQQALLPPSIRIDQVDSPITSVRNNEDNNDLGSSPGLGIATLAPPIPQLPMSTPGIRPGLIPPIDGGPALSVPHTPTATHSRDAYDVDRPTCSLNLVCYRGGSQGCVLVQVHTILESRFTDTLEFKDACDKDPRLIHSDQEFFRGLQRAYWPEMCGIWRRYLSLKTLRGIRLLMYSPVTRPAVVPMDDFVLQEMYYAYRYPDSVKTETSWIEWVFKLRQPNKRHALEFVEGWNSTRVIIAATIPWLISCLVGIVWTAMGGDAQTAFTVAGFILTSGTVVLALLAVISGIESSARGYTAIG